MLKANSKINISSYGSKLTVGSTHNTEAIKQSCISKMTKMSELNEVYTVRDMDQNAQRCKIVKLIGDQDQNIQQIMTGINCVCGSKADFKNILNLLMGKIYRLREERNFYKKQLELQINKIKQTKNNNKTVMKANTGTNTDYQIQDDMKQELRKLIEDSKSVIDMAGQSNIRRLKTQQMEELIRMNRLTSITFHEQANETNLLEDNPIWNQQQCQNISRLSFDQNNEEIEQDKILKESNAENSNLDHLRTYCKQNCLNLNKLQNYIEKVNCARELDKYQIDKRKRTIF